MTGPFRSCRVSTVALLLAFAACKNKQSIETGIVVEVTSDLAVPNELDQIRLTSTDFQGGVLLERMVAIGSGPGRVSLPLREGLYPLHDTSTPIQVKVTGMLGAVSVVSNSATLSFVQGRQVVLPLPLLAACASVKCAAFETCKANGKCKPDTVASTELPTYTPNQPSPGEDAATRGSDAEAMLDARADTIQARDLGGHDVLIGAAEDRPYGGEFPDFGAKDADAPAVAQSDDAFPDSADVPLHMSDGSLSSGEVGLPECQSAGQTQCGPNGGVQTCVNVAGHLSWGSEGPCPGPQRCSGDAPDASCQCPTIAECMGRQGTFCSLGVLSTCGRDANGCVDVTSRTTCPAGRPCVGTFGNASCSCVSSPPECAAGVGTFCQSGSTLGTCGVDGNGCLSVTDVVSCGTIRACQGNAPSAACTCPPTPAECEGKAGTICKTNNSIARCGYDAAGCLALTDTASCSVNEICVVKSGVATCSPHCGNGVLDTSMGETCDSDCQALAAACVGDANSIRTASGSVASCTFACQSVARGCGLVTDGFCPAVCTPVNDIDCLSSPGADCVNPSECSTGKCVDRHCCNTAVCGTCLACTGADGSCQAVRGADDDLCTGTNTCAPTGKCQIRPSPIGARGNNVCVVVEGQVLCWGDNSYGQLGDGTTTNSSTPAAVASLNDVFGLTVGTTHACALLRDGSVACWGGNAYGQLGNGTTSNSTPVAVTGLTNVASITAGRFHTCALLGDGTVRCWGNNEYGQLGDGTITNRPVPVAVGGLSSVTMLSAASWNNCAVLTDTTVKCWGENSGGQLGNGNTTSSPTPVLVQGLSGVAAVAAGTQHTCALLSDKTVRCWGANPDGRLGDGTSVNRLSPVTVGGLTDVLALHSAPYISCARLSDTTMRCWGGNSDGEIGDGTTTNRLTPTSPGLTGVLAIAPGGQHTCAMLRDGGVRCWGYNQYGQLGDGTTTNSASPVTVRNLP